MTLLLIILNLTILSVSLIYTYKNSVLVTPWLIIFTCIWTIPVGISVYHSGVGIFDYAFSAYTSVITPYEGSEQVLNLIAILLFTSVFMLLGTFLGDKMFNHSRTSNTVVVKNIGCKTKFLFFLWCFVCLVISALNGFPWFYIFIPIYAPGDIYVNYIFRTIYLMVPLYCLFLAIASDRKDILFIVFIWALVVSLSTGQRRNFLTFMLYCIYLYSYFKYSDFHINRLMSFKKYLVLFFSSFSMVIVLWVLRVVSTNYIRYGFIINPFENRSAFDILFGSGATGVATGYVIVDWVEKEMFLPFYNVMYGFSQIIPRGLWDSKPVGLDSVIKNYYQLEVSPSVFWFGDYLISCGYYLLPIVAFVFSLFITFGQKFLVSKIKSTYVILSALIFANTFTYYKNGLGMFIATIFTSYIIIVTCHLIFNVRLGFSNKGKF